jgi:predicted GNAT family acetyltransferase
MTDTFRDNPDLGRFELETGGLLSIADYRREPGRLVIPHVESDPALRGQGAAGRLMAQVAEVARTEDLKIVPICSYAAAWLKRNDPELIA